MKKMKIRVYPYKQGSKSAKQLANSLGGKVLKHVGSQFRPKRTDFVVNWGSSDPPDFQPATTLNAEVRVAQDKLLSFRAFKEHNVPHPQFWETTDEIEDNCYPVVCRTVLNGHSGNGIVIANDRTELVVARLYTQYVKKQEEYRVHVLKDKVFFIQRKAKRLDEENPNWLVRNLEGGFVFVHVEEEDVPDGVKSAAISAIAALGLDFGGVDVIWNEHRGAAYVLEVNTACGLEERTALAYKQAFENGAF